VEAFMKRTVNKKAISELRCVYLRKDKNDTEKFIPLDSSKVVFDGHTFTVLPALFQKYLFRLTFGTSAYSVPNVTLGWWL
jgi:hypothetical protein